MGSGRFEGRVAIVTGASRGIGAALARTLASEGAAVACAARTVDTWDERLPGTIHETVSAIRDEGGTALAVRCDLTVQDDLEHLVETTTRELGAADILVNNAALTVPGRPPAPGAERPPATSSPQPKPSAAPSVARPGFAGFPLKGYRLHFEVDLFGPFRLMQLVLPAMMEQGLGSILNITSHASRMPGEGPYPDAKGTTTFAYGGAKAALEHLTQAVAYEAQQYGIGVNALMPSKAVATPGLLAIGAGGMTMMPMEDFCEAAMRLLASPPDVTNGYIAFSDDVLHPELGRRGWIGD